MFILTRYHDEIVERLEAELASMRIDRDFYRDLVLQKTVGVTFPKPAEMVETARPEPEEELTEGEKVARFRINRMAQGWTVDDFDIYQKYWVEPNSGRYAPEEMDWHYVQRFGNMLPLTAFVQ